MSAGPFGARFDRLYRFLISSSILTSGIIFEVLAAAVRVENLHPGRSSVFLWMLNAAACWNQASPRIQAGS